MLMHMMMMMSFQNMTSIFFFNRADSFLKMTRVLPNNNLGPSKK